MSVFGHLEVCHDDGQRAAALNMAIDEALLEKATTPTIRFYGWKRSAVSFGYFGRFEEAAKIAGKRDVVRRWTGGGIVLHGTDITYSIAIPATDHSFARSSKDFYFDVHAAIQQVLFEEGINAALADSALPKISDACFANAVWADVLVKGTKVAGAAQRRTRKGLLQQGSIQHPHLPPDLAFKFVQKLSPSARMFNLRPDFIEYAQRIAHQKYGTREWLLRR